MLRSFVVLLCLLAGPARAIKPDRVYQMQPAALQLPFDTAMVKTPDGIALSVWAFRPPAAVPPARTTVLMAYGDSGNKSYWLTQASMLANNGYNVVLFDYRGFGGSADYPVPADSLYCRCYGTDLRTATDWTRKQFPGTRLVLYAFSMGTIVTGSANVASKVDAFVFEGLVSRPDSVVARIAGLKKKTVLLSPDAKPARQALEQLAKPVLVFAGTSDPVTTAEDARLFTKGKAKRELVTFKGGHGQGFTTLSGSYPGEAYIGHIRTFLAKY